jgi:uncharacterized LabA/DUF88 family protein
MFRRKVKSALLIDFDNIAGLVGARNFVDCIAQWMAWLEDGQFDAAGRKRQFMQKRVYWNLQFEQFQGRFEQMGFAALTCRSLVKRKKSNADMILALDALESAFGNDSVEEYVFLTTDTDFVPLLERLGGMDKDTVITIAEGTASEREYPRHADIVIPSQAFKGAFSYQRPRKLIEQIDAALRTALATLRSGASRVGAAAARLRSRLRSLGNRSRSTSNPDLAAAGQHVAELARSTPGLLLGRKTVMRWLAQHMPQFTPDGRHRFLGCNSYAEMIEKMVSDRTDLDLVRHPNGGIAIRAPARDEAA